MTTVPVDKLQPLLDELIRERILVLDGAMGTMVHACGFQEKDYRGSRFPNPKKDLKNLIDILVLTQPEAIRQIHREYLAAGADIIETNTFGASQLGCWNSNCNRSCARSTLPP